MAVAACVAALILLCGPAAATTLITAREAHLPFDNTEVRSGIERGPDITAVYPAAKSGVMQSPFDFRVKFVPHGGTQIDLDSLRVIYMRKPAIDLTQRVRKFVQPSGIVVPDAEVPPGVHRILIFIKDTSGHEGQADIRFEIGQ
jgi:hypothetical protein